MYVITGASGQTGAAVANALLAAKKPVRVLLRDAKRGEDWKARGAEVVTGDIADAASLEKAFRGATGAYLVIPPDYQAPEALDRARTFAQSIRQAIAAAKLPHAVLLSSVGAELVEGSGIVKTLYEAERILGELDTPITFLRAAYFMENAASSLPYVTGQGVLPSALTIDRKIPTVSVRDIGEAAAQALLEPATGRRIIELSGPADYSPTEVAAAFARLLAKPVTAVPVALEDFEKTLQSFGFSADAAALMRGLNAGINDGAVRFGRPGTVARRGRVSLEDALRPLVSKV